MVSYQQLRSFYEGKKVLITGHTGFKGTWLTALLYKLGARIKGYALEPEESKPFFDLFSKYDFIESVVADIRDKAKLMKEINSFEPDYIFHLAAQPLVLRSYEIPAETFEINVTGSANLLEALRGLPNKCAILIVTTDKVYENKEQNVLFKETDRLGGHDPYSSSKACTEMVVESFRNSFFHTQKFTTHQKALSSARAGNVIGGGDWSQNRIIPDTAKALLKNIPILVRNPQAVRPWQHVLEPLCGYLLLGGRLYQQPSRFSIPFNFGPLPEDHMTVMELVDLAIKVWGKGQVEIAESIENLHEANLLQLDISRAYSELKWKPKLTAWDAIQWSMEWYKVDKDRQAEFTFTQIDNYLAK